MDAILNHVNTEEKIIITLLDNMEGGLKYGLCYLSIILMEKGIIDGYLYDDINEWLLNNLPNQLFNIYSWPTGEIEPRYYWLKSKLAELYNQK